MSLELTHGIDFALLVFYAFVAFFVGLVIYLNRESRREGFPLEDDLSGRVDSKALFLDPAPKLFRLPFGRPDRTTADYARHPVDLPVRRERFHGSPLIPTGNPLIDGIGPATWADRQKVPDLNMEGHPRIVPMGSAGGIGLESRDANPVGMTVIAADGVAVGPVTDVWIDRADLLIRYLTIDIGMRTVLAPFAMAKVKRASRTIVIDAITAAQFADAPAIEGVDVITFYEEDRVQAYFGGGYLYATAARSEPIL